MGSTGAQQFCVRWNSYQSNLQNAFPKLLLNENFVDVTLACEAQMIKCHKVVLSACSSYFESLLSQNPCQHPIIFMKDMKYWEIRALVDFMYRGEVNVTQEELTNLLKAAEALQVRGLYGYEQQQRAAAVAQNSESTPSEIQTEVVSTPTLPANTTLQSLQDCKAQAARSRGSSTHDDSNDQMVKLEEEIMMMEEQSISDSSHLDNDYSALGSSQEFDGFVGDQRYPAPAAVMDADQGAGPSGLTLTPSSNSSPSLHQDKLMAQQHLQQQQQYQQLQQRQRSWTTTPSRPPPTSTTQRSNNKTKTLPRGPNVWETLPKEEMMKQLAIAADLIDQGNSYRRVSNLLHIPKSTIYSYVTKRRASKGILAKKKNSKSPVKKIVYPPPVRVKVEINEQRTNFQSSDESQ